MNSSTWSLVCRDKAAKALAVISVVRGTTRIQKFLTSHPLCRGRGMERYPYPLRHLPLDAPSIGWEGSPDTWVGWNIRYRGSYHSETLGVLAANLRPSSRMIEVGANEGYHTVFAGLLVGTQGR